MEKDRFDALMKLAEFRLSRRNIRTAFDWKITLVLWAALAGIIYLKFEISPYLLGPALILLVSSHALLWSGQIWARNEEDMKTAFYYASHAEHLLFPNEHAAPKEKSSQDSNLFDSSNFRRLWSHRNWGFWFQIFGTTLLSCCVFWISGLGHKIAN
jgi:hypothetical protein